MDMRQLALPDATFDTVVDKAALDSVLCSENSYVLAGDCLKQISRVLTPTGVYICVSHGVPKTRLPLLERPEYGWQVSVKKIAKPMLKYMREEFPDITENDDKAFHYIYTCHKRDSIN
jgi:EEF1A lysine methyltransferase 4